VQNQNEVSMEESQKSQLVAEAVKVRRNAYAPYSKFHVGSAILTSSGKIFTGCNVENASYGLTICAERNAVFQAVAKEEQQIVAVVVSAKVGKVPCAPCGACRQVLNEFGPDMLVILADENGNVLMEKQLSELLPNAFGPKNLE
jgi:cytidine deaminase